ncbi:MAG: N-6 DNA methylase [Asgard group archaeon]|nr:N-6 DNA methylase [Asgard group archaeon]
MDNKKHSIFNDFIQQYLFHLIQIQEENLFNLSEGNLREFYYFLVKKLLYEQFDKKLDLEIELIPQKIIDDKSFQKFNEKYILLLKRKLINQFKFKSKENIDEQTEITPYIFSLIFEYSQYQIEKQKIGVYYTSNIEINFMCKEAISHYLFENSPVNEMLLIDLIWKNQDEFQLKNMEKVGNSLSSLLEKIRILDPCCGSGGFLIGMIQVLLEIYQKIQSLNNKKKKNSEIIEKLIQTNLFGIDIQAEALAITKLRLFLYASALNNDHLNFKNIIFNLQQKNTLLTSDDDLFSQDGLKFNLIIGNPPFIRQEGHVIKFPNNLSHWEYKEKILLLIEENCNSLLNLPRDRKSDFYIYFFYRSISLLKKGGVLCFVTPNSWLDVKYGLNFKKILLDHFHIKRIYLNNQVKSFRSGINTIISVLVKKQIEESLITKFVQFEKFFDEIQQWELIFKQISQDQYINSIDFKMNRVDKGILRNQLENQLNFKNKWGAYYFRSPKILTNLLENKQKNFIGLKSLGQIRYPMKTGLNEYFIINKEVIKKFGIEKEYLIPLIKSPKKISSINISSKDLEKFVFNCNESIEDLKRNGKDGALRYINWGEKQVTLKKQQSRGNEKYPDVPTVKTHYPYWYSLRKVIPADIFCNRFFDRRFYFSYSIDYVIEDQTFYGLKLEEDIKNEKMLIIALLNSTLSYLILEVYGRTTLGRGALQYSINDLNILPTLNPREIPKDIKIKIIEQFKPILSRRIKSIFDECKSKDRQEFDLTILNWLGLDKNSLSELYTSILNLVGNRLKKSVQKITFY